MPEASAPGASPVRREVGALGRLAGPLIAGQLATVGMSFVDAVMAGRISAEALAAVAVGSGIWSSMMVFGIGVLLAVPPSVSQLVGAERDGEVGAVARQAYWVAAGLTGLTVAVLWGAGPLLSLLDVEPVLVPTILGYLRALSWGAPALFVYLVLRFVSEGLSLTRPVMYFGWLGLAVNVVANQALMYGRWGFPELGAVGCGHATSVVFWFQLLAMALYVRRGRHYRMHRLGGVDRPDRAALAELLAVGLPVGGAVFVEVSMFAGVGLLMASVSAVATAGHQVALNFCSLTFMVPLGVAMATTVRVGRAAGRGDAEGVRRAGFAGMGVGLLAQTVPAFLMIVFPSWIARVYTQDPEVIATAVGLLFYAALFQFSDGLQVVAAGALRGLKDTRWPMVITFFAYWIVGLPGAVLLAFAVGLGPPGMWMGMVAGLTVAAALLTVRFLRLSRPRALLAPPSR